MVWLLGDFNWEIARQRFTYSRETKQLLTASTDFYFDERPFAQAMPIHELPSAETRALPDTGWQEFELEEHFFGFRVKLQAYIFEGAFLGLVFQAKFPTFWFWENYFEQRIALRDRLPEADCLLVDSMGNRLCLLPRTHPHLSSWLLTTSLVHELELVKALSKLQRSELQYH
ncbi:MAG: hypothetical protein ACK417_10945 [Bacteroidia bacterium]